MTLGATSQKIQKGGGLSELTVLKEVRAHKQCGAGHTNNSGCRWGY